MKKLVKGGNEMFEDLHAEAEVHGVFVFGNSAFDCTGILYKNPGSSWTWRWRYFHYFCAEKNVYTGDMEDATPDWCWEYKKGLVGNAHEQIVDQMGEEGGFTFVEFFLIQGGAFQGRAFLESITPKVAVTEHAVASAGSYWINHMADVAEA